MKVIGWCMPSACAWESTTLVTKLEASHSRWKQLDWEGKVRTGAEVTAFFRASNAFCSVYVGKGFVIGPDYSAQFRGLDSDIRNPLLSSIFLTPKNPEVIPEIIKFGFSEASQIPSCLSQKIPLIRTIPTVPSVFSYLLWGTRNGSCRFLCLHVLSRLPLDVYGRIIHCWKGILKGNPTPSE